MQKLKEADENMKMQQGPKIGEVDQKIYQKVAVKGLDGVLKRNQLIQTQKDDKTKREEEIFGIKPRTIELCEHCSSMPSKPPSAQCSATSA